MGPQGGSLKENLPILSNSGPSWYGSSIGALKVTVGLLRVPCYDAYCVIHPPNLVLIVKARKSIYIHIDMYIYICMHIFIYMYISLSHVSLILRVGFNYRFLLGFYKGLFRLF